MNYHHLRYFWVVAREGGLVAASKLLRVSHPTLSTQIHSLEEALGEDLFHKVGRKLELTDTGRVVFRYADEIFTLGRELVDTVKGVSTGKPLRFNVGIAGQVPKLAVSRLLQPVRELEQDVQIVCYQDSHDKLIAALAVHTLHVVISDSPVATGSPIRAYSHSLGQTEISFFATARLARKYRTGFPQSLDGAPMLLPLENVSVRRALNQWFGALDIRPRIVGEFEDSALLKSFGADGVGVFPAPTLVESMVTKRYGVRALGKAEGVTESYYAISAQRRLTHPAVVAIERDAQARITAD